jgi:diaminohydroxyphosphoribosylaminopyrimidine deaminase/5-amino-6-(5-phosphoribosylamino)uracil reductase
MTSDEHWMRRALELAERGRGAVEPNPLVGAVVVRDGVIVGEGWHTKFGAAHAEVHALSQAGEQAHGATMFVTLEPCCHHGKTPPCTDAIVRAGITHVNAALADPFPKVAGQGAKTLRDVGITVDFGLCEGDARRQNAPYLKLLATGRPYVHAKWAMSLDGKIATRTGASKWISGEAARAVAHSLRGRMDGIVVGIGTALADDPRLTARPPGPRTATRVVLDRQARLPATSRLVTTARETPTLVATTCGDTTRLGALVQHGCEVLVLTPDAEGRPSVTELLDELGRRRWTNLLVEGGADVLGAFADAGAIDEAHVFLAPIVVGGRDARTPLRGHGIAELAEALRFQQMELRMVGEDAYVRLWNRQGE